MEDVCVWWEGEVEDVCVWWEGGMEDVQMEMEVDYIQDSGSGRWGWLSLGAERDEPERQGPPANIAQS